jgi:hypothetical protein
MVLQVGFLGLKDHELQSLGTGYDPVPSKVPPKTLNKTTKQKK